MLVLVAACGGGAAAPPALSAVLEPAQGARVLRVVLTAAGSPVTVRGLQVRGGGFVQVPTSLQDGVVAAGSQAGFVVAYGTALCEGRPAPVAVLVDTPGGRREVQVPGDGVLAGLRARECASAR